MSSAKEDEDDLETRRLRGEAVLERIRKSNKRRFLNSIERDRNRRSADDIKAAYAEAMKDKRKSQP